MMSSVVSRLLRSKPAAFRLPPSHQLYHTAVRRPEVLASNGQVLFNQIALPLHRHKCSSSSQRPATHIAGRHSRWWKVAAAAAAATLVSGGAAAAIAICSLYLETVPYTNRKHLIVHSIEYERRLGDLVFHYAREMYGASNILDRLHPESVRVHLITSDLVRAIPRGLAIRSLKQGGSPEAARRQTAHLDGFDWDAILVRDEGLGVRSTPSGMIILHTGCLDLFKTDEEIASVIAHEIGHVVARHSVERSLYRSSWFPSCLRHYLLQRQELEADHIGILLLGAAGYDPRAAPTTIETINEKLGSRKACATHPSNHTRLQLLSKHKVMEEALQLYREVKATDSLCLTLRSMAKSPEFARFLFGE